MVGKLFSPYSVGRPKLLLDGEVLKHYGHGVSISKWEDLSGLNNHVLQATGANQPVAQLVRGTWCAYFDGVNRYLQAGASWGGDASYTTFIVQQTAGDCILVTDVSNYQQRIGQSTNSMSQYDAGANNPQTAALAIARTDWSVLGYQRSSGGSAIFNQEGRDYSTGSLAANLAWSMIGTTAAQINGYVAYVLHYGFALTLGQIDYVMQGLTRKFWLPSFR